jgi:ADP-ribose pyrophosphatase YjhB (NUDIX family)
VDAAEPVPDDLDSTDPIELSEPPAPADEVRRLAVKVAAVAKGGLTYSQVSWDIDRYHQITDLAARLMAAVSNRTPEELTMDLGRDVGYTTPKIDVRGVLFDEDERVLLLRERLDGRWSVPGGYADPGEPPSLNAVREVREETGYPAEVIKLFGCWDRDLHGLLPRMPIHIYKLFFLCRQTGEPAQFDALETLDIGWFAMDELPVLSPGRVNEYQLQRALAHHRNPDLPTEFD